MITKNNSIFSKNYGDFLSKNGLIDKKYDRMYISEKQK